MQQNEKETEIKLSALILSGIIVGTITVLLITSGYWYVTPILINEYTELIEYTVMYVNQKKNKRKLAGKE